MLDDGRADLVVFILMAKNLIGECIEKAIAYRETYELVTIVPDV